MGAEIPKLPLFHLKFVVILPQQNGRGGNHNYPLQQHLHWKERGCH